ncbi:MAG: penicillin acylase family protein, partial [Pseudomonadota bacterium]
MLLRLLRWGVSVAALAGAAVFAAAYYFASRSLPDYSAVRPVAGVTDAVEILRDAHAAPHVFAKTEGDVFFGLGYAHAQDRLWQMEFRRRIAQGRLADLFGPAARLAESLGLAPAGGGGAEGLSQRLAEIDAVARGFDLYGASERSLGALSPSARRALEAYSAGVNAWLAEVDREALGRGAPELMALQASVSPWRPVDSVAAFKLLAATLSAPSLITELRRARYLVAQGPTRTEDLFPDAEAPPRMAPPPYKAAAAPAGAARAEAADAATPTAAETAEGLAALGLLFGPAQPQAPARPADAALAALFPFPFSADAAAFAGASNAWAVSGRRSATRAPLLATDPHLPLSAPSIWHLARLEFGDGGVIGGTIAGIPAVLIGRNERIAWGLTTLSADVADVYIEKLNPENPNEYLTPDGPRPFETRETLISLGGGEAVRARLRRTRHGPVLPLAWPGLGGRAVTQPGEVTPKGAVAAVAWTVFDDADR